MSVLLCRRSRFSWRMHQDRGTRRHRTRAFLHGMCRSSVDDNFAGVQWQEPARNRCVYLSRLFPLLHSSLGPCGWTSLEAAQVEPYWWASTYVGFEKGHRARLSLANLCRLNSRRLDTTAAHCVPLYLSNAAERRVPTRYERWRERQRERDGPRKSTPAQATRP